MCRTLALTSESSRSFSEDSVNRCLLNAYCVPGISLGGFALVAHLILSQRMVPQFEGIWASEKLGKVPPGHHKGVEGLFFFSCILLSFLFCIGVQPINSVVIVSSGHQRDSAIQYPCVHSPPNPLPSRPPHNTEQRSQLQLVLLVICFKYSSLYLDPQQDGRLGLVPL